MAFSDILYNLLIGPLEILFEIIFSLAYEVTANPGFSIIVMSLIMNFLLLPLYNRTDAIQDQAIAVDKQMRPYVNHIKKTFKGNEQFMMLQTCYRQNHYKPTDALKGLSPLMLEIPFFMAAYNYLSNLGVLNSAAMGPIANLGAPDGLLTIGGLSLNLLPILMTVINIGSSLIYTREAPLRTKLQLYGMAGLFLILLYDSPSGLAFYWTLNNLFSLVKNIIIKSKHPFAALTGIGGMGILVLAFWKFRSRMSAAVLIPALLAAMAILAAGLYLGIRFRKTHPKAPRCKISVPVVVTKKDYQYFLTANLILTVLAGILIPSAVIHNSPEEFIQPGSLGSPNLYVLYTALIIGGFCLVWLSVFYMLAAPRGKKWMEVAVWVLAIGAIVNYMFFGRNYGTMSSNLNFDQPITITRQQILLNLAVLAAVILPVVLILRKKPAVLQSAGAAVVAAAIGMSAFNLAQSQTVINRKLSQLSQDAKQTESICTLSTKGKNVLVLMMDRAINDFVPYILNEKPELQAQFAGFTYYPNTLSYGAHTNFGLPAVFGGYEYTPLELNKRDQELLADKHDEALKVMPVLFSENGYLTTVNDPTYAGYDWIPDLSIYDEYPEITARITMGNIQPEQSQEFDQDHQKMNHQFLYYSFFKTSPVLLHEEIYDGGKYHRAGDVYQSFESNRKAKGTIGKFLNSKAVLDALPDLTQIQDTDQNTFMMICNDTAHSPVMLQLPDYEPRYSVDNTKYDKPDPERSTADGQTMVMTNGTQISHYHANMATFLSLGRWFDYLREQNVYDNTRIIIVSDHGYNARLHEEMFIGEGGEEDVMYYNPILMVKDFGDTEFKTDDTFMTNADVPSLAAAGLIEDPVNPFTGKAITSLPKEGSPQYVCGSHIFQVEKNNGTTFLPDTWFAVDTEHFRDGSRWTILDSSEVPMDLN